MERLASIFDITFNTYEEALIVNRVINIVTSCALAYYLIANIGNLGLQLTYITLAFLFFLKRKGKVAEHEMINRTTGALSQVFVALLVTINEEDGDLVQRAVDKYNDELIEAGEDPLEFKFVSQNSSSDDLDMESEDETNLNDVSPITPEQWKAFKESVNGESSYELPDDSEEEE